MLIGRQLLQWHQAIQQIEQAENQLSLIRQEEQTLKEKVDHLEQQLAAQSPSDDPDRQIARLLIEQELWMAQNTWQRMCEQSAEKRVAIKQVIEASRFERLELEQGLDEVTLAEYQRVSESKQNPIVEVRQKSCMGCFLPLSVSNLAEWRRGKGLVFCHECGRILV